jgi:hypothetical protein
MLIVSDARPLIADTPVKARSMNNKDFARQFEVLIRSRQGDA